MRFQIGHTPQTERIRVPMGRGVVGQVALTRQSILLNDVSTSDIYVAANPEVRSELAVPLIAKNRLIGVMDIESEQANYFRPEHLHLLTLTASRIAQAIENARLYTRVSRQAQTLSVLNEIAVELTSILDLDPLLERVGQLLRRLIDYQMFTVMLLDDKGEFLVTRYAGASATHAPAPHLCLQRPGGRRGPRVAPINVPDVRKDPRYLEMNPETRSELIMCRCFTRAASSACSTWNTRAPGFFNEDHERVLTTLAAQVAISIENARLYQAVRRQEAQLERDIAMAREVQLRLLPPTAPEHPTPTWPSAFCPRAPSAATSTTSSTTDPTAPPSSSATSAAKPRRQRSSPRWSAASCAPPPRSSLDPAQMLAPSTTPCRSASSTRNTSPCSSPCGTTKTRLCRWPTPAPSSPLSAARASPAPSRRRASRSASSPTSPTTSSTSPRSPATPSSLSPMEFSTPKTTSWKCTAMNGLPPALRPPRLPAGHRRRHPRRRHPLPGLRVR
jgi:putative methionine-R-sulfoxide reductase with GAF domain